MATAVPIALDGTVATYSGPTGPTWLTFTATKGKAYTLTLTGARPIAGAPRPYVYDEVAALGWTGQRVLSDTSIQLVLVAPRDESIYLKMADFANASGTYQLSMLESAPGDVTWYYDRYDPDDTTTTAKTIPVDGTPQTRIFWYRDWIAVPVVAGRGYHVEAAWVAPRNDDTAVQAYNSDGTLLSDSILLSYPRPQGMNFTAPRDGVVYLRVSGSPTSGREYTTRVWESTGRDITGTVTRSPGGAPVEGAAVVLYQKYSDANPMKALAATVTAIDGSYAFDAFPGITYVVGFSDPAAVLFGEWAGGWPTYLSHPAATALLPGAKLVIDGRLHEAAGVAGRVVDRVGSPVAGATVRVEQPTDWGSWAEVGQEVTGPDGAFAVAGLDPTPAHRLVVQAPDERVQIAEQPLALVDGATTTVEATVAAPATISGTITDPTGPIPATAQFLVTLRRAADPNTVVASALVTSVTNTYSFTGLRPDSWVVRIDEATNAYPQCWYGATPFTGTGSVIDVGWDERIAVDLRVGQLAGATRYETAESIGRSAFATGSCDAVIVATGRNYPDALGAAGLAGAAGCPILLVNGASTTLDPTVRSEALRVTSGATPRMVYVVGGTGAVSTGIEAGLRTAFGKANVVRLAGATRYDTANAVAVRARAVLKSKGVAYSGKAICVTGASYADALLAAPVAYSRRLPVLLVGPVGPALKTTLSTVGVKDVYVIGSASAVTKATYTNLASALGGSAHVTRPCSESDPYRQSVAVADWAVSTQGLSWRRVGIATGATYPDALAAGPAQGLAPSPLLLTPSGGAVAVVTTALSAHKSEIEGLRFYGGTGAVSQATRDAMAGAIK
jgi:hypothetical protein